VEATETNKKVGLFLPNDTDGIEIGKVAPPCLRPRLHVVDVGRFQGGNQ
jgi:hypothetical protein